MQQTIKLTKSILRIAVSNIKLGLSITVKDKTSSEVQFMTCEFHMLLAGNCSYLEPIHRQMLSGFCTECWPRASSCLWRGFVKWDLVRGYRHRWLSQNDSGFNLSESVNFIEKFGLEDLVPKPVCHPFNPWKWKWAAGTVYFYLMVKSLSVCDYLGRRDSGLNLSQSVNFVENLELEKKWTKRQVPKPVCHPFNPW